MPDRYHKNYLTSRQKNLTSEHKDQTRRYNYLTSDGRNMPPYTRVLHLKTGFFILTFFICTILMTITQKRDRLEPLSRMRNVECWNPSSNCCKWLKQVFVFQLPSARQHIG